MFSSRNTPDPASLDDEGLLLAIADGQQVALSILYDRYGRLAFSLAVTIVEDGALAEEITQDVFIQIWNKAATYQSEQGKVVTWLASITRHRAIDILRRRGARPEGHQVDWEEGLPPDLPEEAEVESLVELAQEKRHIRQAIAALPREQRDALALAFFKGYTHQQIADSTGEPLGTVKTRIRLAMQKLRQILENIEE
jgi:RNA polymerase sigma-70 factor (ECF subfamily)